jgi:hypothetical protein
LTQLGSIAERVRSREDFVRFLEELRKNYVAYPTSWENQDLASFLEAFAMWVEDMDGYYLNRKVPAPDQPSWGTLADMFMGARSQE